MVILFYLLGGMNINYQHSYLTNFNGCNCRNAENEVNTDLVCGISSICYLFGSKKGGDLLFTAEVNITCKADLISPSLGSCNSSKLFVGHNVFS
jgi:hypothetical protein